MTDSNRLVRPQTEDPRIIGPYWDYVQEEAEIAHREAYRNAPRGHRFSHEWTWESREIGKVIKDHKVPPELAGALVKVFYIGRESSEREKPGADRIRATAVNSLAQRVRAAVALAVENELHNPGRDEDGSAA